MLLLDALPAQSRLDRALLDSGLLAILIFPLLYFGVFRPMTVLAAERKRVTAELQEKESFLSESQRLGHVGSWLYDATGRTAWSDEMYRLFGVSRDAAPPTAESFVGLVHPDDRPAMQSWMAACAAGEQPRELEFRVNMPDGTTRLLLGCGEAVHDVEHRLVRMAGTARDVTERKQAEAALRDSDEHYRAVTRSASDAIVTADGAGNIVDWNLSAERMFGRTEADVRAQPLTSLMPPRYRGLHRDGFERVQAGGEPHVIGRTVQLEGLRKDGSEFPIELSLAESSANRGRFFTAIIRDITTRRQAEADRERLIAELQEALANVKSLSGLLPICAGCKKIRDDRGYWNQVDAYISQHTDARFTHGLCPECIAKLYPELGRDDSSG
jgi:PAS domain S-box-containing protein